MQTNKIFNPYGDDSIAARRIVGGNPTNLNNFNDVKYTWANGSYRTMMGNFWIPEKIDMSQDKQQWHSGEMSERDKEGCMEALSFLTYLDSLATHNLPNVASFITAPEVKRCITIQTAQEVVHSQSYAYVFESLFTQEERRKTLYRWRDSEALFKRNEYIAGIYERFASNPCIENLGETLIANYIMEGLYFYNGFNYFYNLEYRKLLMGTAANIRYINRDEWTHTGLFKNIIREVMNEIPDLITQTMVEQLYGEAVEQETEWALGTFSGTVGHSDKSVKEYTRWLANRGVSSLGFKEMYKDIENPYKHLERLKPDSGEDKKQNFFEGTVTEYNMAASIEGWDEV